MVKSPHEFEEDEFDDEVDALNLDDEDI